MWMDCITTHTKPKDIGALQSEKKIAARNIGHKYPRMVYRVYTERRSIRCDGSLWHFSIKVAVSMYVFVCVYVLPTTFYGHGI